MLYSNVEFSVSEDLASQTMMVPASAVTIDDLADGIEAYPFAEEWFVGVKNMTQQVAPDAALFRIDSDGHSPSAFSWYLRFPVPPDDDKFYDVMRYAKPFRWVGPRPSKVGSAVKLPGPRGLGLRVRSNGAINSAIYYRITDGPASNPTAAIERLLNACGLPARLAEVIVGDLGFACMGELSVIGVDQGSDARVGALKFNLEDVPTRQATQFLTSKGSPKSARDRVETMATALRARTISYLGLKYTQDGFAGWRAYFSCEPARVTSIRSVKVLVGGSVSGKSRIPQY